MTDAQRAVAPVSFASLALWVAGSGVLVLGLTAVAVSLLPVPPVGRAVIVVVGVVLTIVAMGVASHRVTARAIRAEYGDDLGEGGTGDHTGGDTGGDISRGPDGLG